MSRREAAPSSVPDQLPLDELLRRGDAAVAAAVAEDLGRGDPTSDALGELDTVRAEIVAKQAGIVAGLPAAEAVFHKVDPSIAFSFCVDDGAPVIPGERIATLTGPAATLLAAERTALNLLQRLSGIATLTAAFVHAVAATGVVIRDTRKTAPGLRALDKYAVRVGGGLNHRWDLAALGMIKDNHIAAAGGIRVAVDAVRHRHPDLPLEVEVSNLSQLDDLLSVDPIPERILLDNFGLGELRTAVERIARRAVTEASGGITLASAREVAETGVDELSVGALTHSAPALDLALSLPPAARARAHAAIGAHRRTLGDRIVVLAHHYIRDSIVEHADVVGDSLELARSAAEQDAQWIVFCGVRFMGETAAVLCRPEQQVLLPVPGAGCYLADCADLPSIEAAWERLEVHCGRGQMTPVTYVNSSIELKAFCGRHGGIACTSSNAEDALRWALGRSPRALFFPDRQLGTHAARRFGVPDDEIVLWSKELSNPQLEGARVVVWPGICNVHQRFRPEQIDRVRQHHPEAIILVHPECPPATVARADRSGSTGQLLAAVDAAPPGSTLAIGTEARFVHRLRQRYPDKRILDLSDVPAVCDTMSEITLSDLEATLADIAQGRVDRRRIMIEESTSRWARLAVERMLALPPRHAGRD